MLTEGTRTLCCLHFDAGVAELVDARESKSRSYGVSVRFRPPVPSLFPNNRFHADKTGHAAEFGF